MKNYIPIFISEKTLNKINFGTFTASAMFIDISGFTSMTQALMGHGKEGAEVLSNIINNIFTPSIKKIYDNGGIVSTFAGDAFTAMFEAEKADYALRSAFEINKLFVDSGIVKTKFGEFELAVKIGLSHGEVEFGIIDTEVQKAYYFRGEAVDACAKSEHHAENMQIVADWKFIEKLTIQVERQLIDEHWFILTPKELDISPIEPVSNSQIAEEIEKHFVPDAVLNMKARGEFREIVSVFIGFEEGHNYEKSIKQVIQNTHAYGGYFNKIDFGDKGGVMLVIFGAPTGREKLYGRAADFALSLKEMLDFKFRVGISTGIAFCGIIGSDLRKEYTALGNVVNLSARLMMKTEPHEILTGPQIKSKLPSQYEFENKGLTEFKGFSDNIEIFSLRKKTASKQQLSYSGSFVGRKKEADELRNLIQPIYEDKFGGIIYIDGPAGIGKSRFIDNIVKNLDACGTFYLPCDEVLRKPFNPFEYFFKGYFEQSESLSKEENKTIFIRKYTGIVSQTQNEDIKSELIRTESIIGALIGLEWENSLYAQLDAKGRYENTIFAVKNFFLAQSLLAPLILIVENAPWIDTDSLTMIKVLTRNVGKFPFVIFALCRPNDDGTPYFLIGKEETEMTLNRFEIEPLDKEMMNELIRDRFSNDEIPEKTLEFMRDKSNGNPFFIEQLVLYLSENNLLDSTLNLVNEARSIPSGISQIIIARIDRLSAKMKETVKTASVLGREFTLAVLRKMLSSGNIDPDIEIDNLVSEGIKEQIWQNIKELSYIFKNTLIRDAVYEIQLKETLRSLHELAGSIIEELYSGEINQYCEELADHFDKAGNRNKAVEYLKKAASRAMDNYQNKKALILFDKLLVYLDKESEDTVRTLRKIGDILELTGKWEESLGTFRKALEVAETVSYSELKIECITDLSYLLNTQGKSDEAYELAIQAIETAEKISYENGTANALNVLGSIYLSKGDHSASINAFVRSSEIKEKLGDRKGVATALGNIGAVYNSKGDFEKALEFFTSQKKLSKEISDKLLYS
ncbi:TPA: hypothetical protein DCR49_05295 [Candidatus Delongbacteria bacterium]|nr:MAG: hypothetical protein A2Y39_03475 [Candidatus Delongbacteria bacterium GWF2_40_14]HAQ61401.1 hypothetical protein [Candidatus Delongbacteria bacterium]